MLALAASSFIKMKAYLKNTAPSYGITIILDIRAKQIFKNCTGTYVVYFGNLQSAIFYVAMQLVGALLPPMIS